MRRIDDGAIKAHADLRFRSEYDYALFEYHRSAKVIAFLERAGVTVGGRVLDAGCGGGGMPLSLAEEAAAVVGIDPVERFQDAGVRLGRERGLRNLHFALADGMALPFPDGAFDLVLSHAVIEHVADAPLYLRECARVLAPRGHVYLSTAPYLSFAGAHLPRLRDPGAAAPDRRDAASRSRRSGRSPVTRRGRSRSRPTRTRSSRRRGAAKSRKTTCSRRSAWRGCARRLPPPACASSARSCT